MAIVLLCDIKFPRHSRHCIIRFRQSIGQHLRLLNIRLNIAIIENGVEALHVIRFIIKVIKTE